MVSGFEETAAAKAAIIGLARQLAAVVPITTRVHINDLADSARTDNLNHPDMVLRKSHDVARQNKTRSLTLRRKEWDGGAGRGRNWLLHQHREVSAERPQANLDMGIGWCGDDNGVSLRG